mgnify:CR=1 FL=1
MPPIGKESFIQAIAEIAQSQNQIARFIKSPAGEYWFETGKTTHKEMAAWQGYTPNDAGRIGVRPFRKEVGIGADSTTLNISEDSPERPKTMSDFRSFAEGTGWTIVDFS